MSQLSTAQTAADARERPPTDVLFKHDRPRRIDRVIDFFGGTETAPPGDPCGETILEALGSDDE